MTEFRSIAQGEAKSDFESASFADAHKAWRILFDAMSAFPAGAADEVSSTLEDAYIDACEALDVAEPRTPLDFVQKFLAMWAEGGNPNEDRKALMIHQAQALLDAHAVAGAGLAGSDQRLTAIAREYSGLRLVSVADRAAGWAYRLNAADRVLFRLPATAAEGVAIKLRLALIAAEESRQAEEYVCKGGALDPGEFSLAGNLIAQALAVIDRQVGHYPNGEAAI